MTRHGWTGPILDTAGAAALHGVKRRTIHQWIYRGIFPVPDATISGRPAWYRSTLEAWAEATGRAVRIEPRRKVPA